jgi:hypothetical protein
VTLVALGAALAACSNADDDGAEAVDAAIASTTSLSTTAVSTTAVSTTAVSTTAVSITSVADPAAPGSAAGTVVTGETTLAPTPSVLQFDARLVGGGSFAGASLAGRPTVFWFWAPT